jgi:hypothetical protein
VLRRAWRARVAVALLPLLMLSPDARAAVYFGDLHAHSALSDDASNSPDAFFRVARDVAGLDFVVLSDHDAFMSDNEAEILKTTAASFDVPGRFVAFPGIEWTHRWHMNAYFTRNDVPYCLRDCPEAADFYEFYAPHVLAGEAAAHVNHPADLFKVDWEQIDDGITNGVEVWNTAGAGDNEPGFGNALWALRAGFRLGLVGVSDDHHSDAALPLLGTGLTGCPADALTRENLIAALRARRCWATTGERIVLELDVDGTPMGGELEAALDGRVQVTARAHGTRAGVVIELLRNGDVVARRRCGGTSCTLAADVAIVEPNTFLYTRSTQAGGDHAWSSPVWVRGACPAGRSCLAARTATGGGTSDDDCLTEWLLPASPAFGVYSRARNRVRCTDGDPACDFGDEPGECVVRVGLCFAVDDQRLPGCAAAMPDAFDVIVPAASPDRATREFQNRATLRAAFHATRERAGSDVCSAASDLRVAVGSQRFEIESESAGRVDRDVLTVECVPERSGRRLPRVRTTR